MPRTIATVISCGGAKLIELQTVYGLQDVYDMLEIFSVDAYNIQQANKINHG